MSSPEISAVPEIYAVCGVVEHGDQRGRMIGFPTANLPIEQQAHLDGVWAGWIDTRSRLLPAAISVGNRSTFYGEDGFRLLEAHVLDFDEDLYGQTVTVWMCARLRDQRTFASVEALVEQLGEDVRGARAWAAEGRQPMPIAPRVAWPLPFGRALAIAVGG